MNIETLTQHFDDELDAVPAATGALTYVHRRVKRRRAARWIASASMTMLVVLVVVSMLVPSLPRIAAADGPDTPTRLLIDGDVEVLITDEPIGTVENVERTLTVYGGLKAPEADFDLSALGIEQALIQSEPAWDPTTDPGDVPVVYIGDVAGRSVFLHTNGAISVFDRILHEITDGQSFGPHLCMTVGDTADNGGAGFCTGPGSTQDERSTSGVLTADGEHFGDFLTWFGLPANTAVVVLEHESGESLWQIPYGETVLFDLDGPRPGTFILKALDPSGEILHEAQTSIREFDHGTTPEAPHEDS